MASGADLLLDANKRVLVYGRSGAGKTGLVGKVLEVPEMCPLYVFDFDLRVNSILAVVARDLIVNNLTYDQFRDSTQPGKAFTDAEAKLRELTKAISDGTGPKTVAIDSLTFAEKSIMSRVLMMDGKAPTFPPQLNHYKSVIAQLEDFISKLCGLPINIIVTAHEDIDKDDITGQMVRGIGVTGKKLPTVLPGYFNELWYAEVQALPGKAAEHILRVTPTNLVAARSVYSNKLNPSENHDIWKKLAKLDAEAHAAQAVAQLAAQTA
jgi:AAA domain-containing protein